MKKTVKGLMVLALTVLANLSFANDVYFDVNIIGEDKFKLSVKNVKGDVSLSLWNTTGDELYEETVKNLTSIEKTFDVSDLPNGKYIFQYKDDFKVQKVTFVVSDQLTFHLAASEIQFVPVISQRGSDVAVSLLTNSMERMIVSIYDQYDNLLIKEVIEGEKYIGKKFDFSKVKKGLYNVVIFCNGNTTSKAIEIK